MANSNKPFGLRPVGTLGASSYSGKVRQYLVTSGDANAIYIGDAVKLGPTAGQLNAGDPYYPNAAIAASGDVMIGVCVGVVPTPADLSVNYRKASTSMYIQVETDPNTIYEVQSDVTGVAAADVGLNAELTVTAGTAAAGVSKTVITTPNTTEGHDVQILGLVQAVDNEVGAYSRCLVKLNHHQFANNALGIS